MSVKVKDILKRKLVDLIMVEDGDKGISQWHVQISLLIFLGWIYFVRLIL